LLAVTYRGYALIIRIQLIQRLNNSENLKEVIKDYSSYTIYAVTTRDKLDGEKWLNEIFLTKKEAKEFYAYSVSINEIKIDEIKTHYCWDNYIKPNIDKFYLKLEEKITGVIKA
jgi:hypothetical protein